MTSSRRRPGIESLPLPQQTRCTPRRPAEGKSARTSDQVPKIIPPAISRERSEGTPIGSPRKRSEEDAIEQAKRRLTTTPDAQNLELVELLYLDYKLKLSTFRPPRNAGPFQTMDKVYLYEIRSEFANPGLRHLAAKKINRLTHEERDFVCKYDQTRCRSEILQNLLRLRDHPEFFAEVMTEFIELLDNDRNMENVSEYARRDAVEPTALLSSHY